MSLQQRYNIGHIPHITFKTNLTEDDAIKLFDNMANKEFVVEFGDNVTIFPDMYETNPLQAIGLYVETDIGTDFSPHMSLQYYKYMPENIPTYNMLPKIRKCFLAVANTTFENPDDWCLIRQATSF